MFLFLNFQHNYIHMHSHTTFIYILWHQNILSKNVKDICPMELFKTEVVLHYQTHLQSPSMFATFHNEVSTEDIPMGTNA